MSESLVVAIVALKCLHTVEGFGSRASCSKPRDPQGSRAGSLQSFPIASAPKTVGAVSPSLVLALARPLRFQSIVCCRSTCGSLSLSLSLSLSGAVCIHVYI